jgi:15-cis-phytoene synthase
MRPEAVATLPDVFHSRARTFWFAARFLPAERRHAVAGLYAFARAVDDLVDEQLPTRDHADVVAELAAWRRWLEHPTLHVAPDRLLAKRVFPALLTHGVPPEYLQMLVDGVTSDLTRAEIPTWSELRAYCVLVASSVGLAMCHLLGAGDDAIAREAAIELGIAMQLTNILRDVGADLRAGRTYLPVDELASHGYSPAGLAELSARAARQGPSALDDRFRDLLRAQIDRARLHYHRGLQGIGRLPAEARLAILLAARLYQAILDDIEAADYDVFTRRAATSSRFKVAEAMRCALLLRQPAWSGAASRLRPGAASTATLSNMLPLANR